MNAHPLIVAVAALLLVACQPPPPAKDVPDAGPDGGEVPRSNTGPTFVDVGPLSVAAGSELRVELQAIDAEQDPLTYSIRNAPSFVSLSGRTVQIAPDASHVGTHAFELVVSDGALTDTLTLSLEVYSVNEAGSKRNNLTAVTAPSHLDIRQLTNVSGTMVISRQFNGISSVLTWAHRSPTGWSTGVLGDGSFDRAYQGPPPGHFVVWGNRFVAVWNDLQKIRRWAIFEDGTWRHLEAEAPVESITGFGDRLVEGLIQPGAVDAVAIRFFDGVSWSAPEAVSAPGATAGAYVVVHASDEELMVTWFDSRIPRGSIYDLTLQTRRFAQSDWQPIETVRVVQAFPWILDQLYVQYARHVDGTWILGLRVGSVGSAEVRSPDTGLWSSLALPNVSASFEFIPREHLTAIAYSGNGTQHVVIHDGTRWLTDAAVLDGSGTGLRATATESGFLAVYPYGRTLIARRFDMALGEWSSTSQVAPEVTTVGGVAAFGDVAAMATFEVNGKAHAAVWSGGVWTDHVLHEGPSVGLPQALRVAGLDVFYPEAQSVRVRASNGGALEAPVVLAASVFGGSVLGARAKIAGAGGKALAVWDQYDAGNTDILAAYFDGSDWRRPFTLTSKASVEDVATNGSSFVISLITRRYDLDDDVRLIRWSEAEGAGAPFSPGLKLSSDRYMNVASDGEGYLTIWSHSLGSNHFQLMSSTSLDGLTWSVPEKISEDVQVFNAPWWTLSLEGSSAGFVLFAMPSWNTGGSTARARVLSGGTWGPDYPVVGECTAAAGKHLALLCREPAAISAHVFTANEWTRTTLFDGSLTGETSIAASSHGLRVTYGAWTRTWEPETGWTAAVEVPRLSSTVMASDGLEFLGVGPIASSGAGSDLWAWRSTSGVLMEEGALEDSPGEIGAPWVIHDDSSYRAVWTQRDASGLGDGIFTSEL